MDEESPKFQKIMVAFDGSNDSVKAVNVGCSLAEKYGSTLIILHVYSISLPVYAAGAPMPAPVIDETVAVAKKSGEDILGKGLDLVKARHIKAKGELLEARTTLSALIEFAANEKVDLIVVGTRGISGIKRLIMGSVSSGLVHSADCPVLVVR